MLTERFALSSVCVTVPPAEPSGGTTAAALTGRGRAARCCRRLKTLSKIERRAGGSHFIFPNKLFCSTTSFLLSIFCVIKSSQERITQEKAIGFWGKTATWQNRQPWRWHTALVPQQRLEGQSDRKLCQRVRAVPRGSGRAARKTPLCKGETGKVGGRHTPPQSIVAIVIIDFGAVFKVLEEPILNEIRKKHVCFPINRLETSAHHCSFVTAPTAIWKYCFNIHSALTQTWSKQQNNLKILPNLYLVKSDRFSPAAPRRNVLLPPRSIIGAATSTL